MLVLSRKLDESIRIGDNVTITVRQASTGRVSLAVDAPRDVRVVRGELSEAQPSSQATAAH